MTAKEREANISKVYDEIMDVMWDEGYDTFDNMVEDFAYDEAEYYVDNYEEDEFEFDAESWWERALRDSSCLIDGLSMRDERWYWKD